jgi:hypothetical protein
MNNDVVLVLGDNGTYYWQIQKPGSRWGFELLSVDCEQAWNGGFGCGASTWTIVPREEWPNKIDDIDPIEMYTSIIDAMEEEADYHLGRLF